MIWLITLSVALATGLLVFGLLAVLPAHTRAVRTRMTELGLYGETSDDHGRRQRQSRLQDVLRLLGERFTAPVQEWGPVRAKLIHAGYRDPLALPLFMGTRITAAVGLFVVISTVVTLADGGATMALLMAFWGAGLGWIVPGFILSMRVSRRQKEIQKALPDALDLLVICVEAGLGLNQALLRVAAEMRHVNDLLTDEIAQTNLEIRAGTPRERALITMADRTGVADVRSLVTMLIQTERFGTSIARSLRVHAETLRTKRRQRAEEAAAKTTIKLVFPLALCIFPALFVVILGPALIEIFNTLRGLA
jgi:tight adherence protein C